ncbi:MAG: glycosyltransferase family 4 protein [Saprospiraceae bacterium]|nr:glycosyltransferase family 4 protein [Saprospiraceae bacterium]MCF8251489.1 glycosyltransferase family 4 protein [Saprospiraceae bacterium]MCF8280739.1 glycosyltransferase family 4 protein [Bacteroidales bacterium]MCF8313349.1 glycosyltransferase family 4 protein [Saprospiraceae bacterium]MCF8441831.1 glycosyltransferase family 4 protein [Saprospiraceae bacterium]
MRIAVNTRFLLKNRLEGIGLFTHEVVRRLVAQHPEHEFVFFFDRPFDPSFVFGKNVTPVVLFPPARHPFLFVWWFEWSVRQALKRYKIDVFLSPDNFLTLGTVVKTVLVTHDLAHVHYPQQVAFFQRLYYQFFTKKFNHRADQIVAVSEFTKADLVKQYGIAPAKIAVSGNGCRDLFQPLQPTDKQTIRKDFSEGNPYFYYIGAVHPRKNVHRLIAAFDQFKTTTGASHKLLIAGRFAWQAGEVRVAFEASEFQSDIRFLGYVADEDSARLMGAATALVYVSLFEGFGVPLLEAMHAEVPIVTSNVSSLPEVVGEAAILVNPTKVEEIAEAMRRISEDEHLCNKLVASGRVQRTKFNWQRATDVVYEGLLNG